MRKSTLLLLLLLTTVGAVSCVSVKLNTDVEKSKRVVYASPSSSFEEIKVGPADHAWKSSKTGNIISYFSECNPTSIPLERMRDDVMASLPKSNLLSSDVMTFDDREALKSLIEGRVDGIPVRASVLVYQKNGCRYSLNFSGRAEFFDSEFEEYQRFERRFRAP